uniref:Uncharacterized protein n=1 Tax=Craspedostauros australis TaxID=1486917 RepID=A0A7S0F751_9STRA|mmetsp:Transcript_9928/g.27138  ORF Transcript_9928/g.27138 Transcript_9928/m.27138 type:complete len:139 (+) Transcript_9928:91-507(+)
MGRAIHAWYGVIEGPSTELSCTIVDLVDNANAIRQRQWEHNNHHHTSTPSLVRVRHIQRCRYSRKYMRMAPCDCDIHWHTAEMRNVPSWDVQFMRGTESSKVHQPNYPAPSLIWLTTPMPSGNANGSTTITITPAHHH